MKHLNKTIIATTLLTSLFLSQPVLAGEEAIHGDYSDHAATSLESEITASNMKHMHNEQAVRGENKVSYQLSEETSLQEVFPSGKR